MLNHVAINEEFVSSKKNYNFHELLTDLLRSFDFLTVFSGFAFLPYIYTLFMPRVSFEFGDFIIVGFVAASLFVIASEFFGLYKKDHIFDSFQQVKGVVFCWFLVWSVLLSLAFAFKTSADYSRIMMTFMFISGAPTLIATRAILHRVFKLALSKQIIRPETVAVINFGYSDDVQKRLSSVYKIEYSKLLKLEVQKTSTDLDDYFAQEVSQILKAIQNTCIDKVILALPFDAMKLLATVLPQLRHSPLPVLMVTDGWLAGAMPGSAISLGAYSVVEVSKPPMRLSERLVKRLFDSLIALFSLILLSPIMLCVALAVKLDSPGSVFFKQRRLGFNNQAFSIYKFRSMTVMEDGNDVVQARRGDQRVTRVGKFIRATSLDELPQLFNVLFGHMSLVGPRPHALAHDKHYDALISDYSRRRHMKPGLTGWAQVNGLRGETPNVQAMQARVEHDLWYIQNWSLWLDIWIMLKTVNALMSNRNVY